MGKRFIVAFLKTLFIFVIATIIALVNIIMPLWLKCCVLLVMVAYIFYYFVKEE